MNINIYEENYKRSVWEVLKKIRQQQRLSNNAIVKYQIYLIPKFEERDILLSSDREREILSQLFEGGFIVKAEDKAYIEGYNQTQVGDEKPKAFILEMFTVAEDKFLNLFNEYAEYEFDRPNAKDIVIGLDKNGDIAVNTPLNKSYSFNINPSDNSFILLWELAQPNVDQLDYKHLVQKFTKDPSPHSDADDEQKVYNALTSLRNRVKKEGLPNDLASYIFEHKHKKYRLNSIVQFH